MVLGLNKSRIERFGRLLIRDLNKLNIRLAMPVANKHIIVLSIDF